MSKAMLIEDRMRWWWDKQRIFESFSLGWEYNRWSTGRVNNKGSPFALQYSTKCIAMIKTRFAAQDTTLRYASFLSPFLAKFQKRHKYKRSPLHPVVVVWEWNTLNILFTYFRSIWWCESCLFHPRSVNVHFLKHQSTAYAVTNSWLQVHNHWMGRLDSITNNYLQVYINFSVPLYFFDLTQTRHFWVWPLTEIPTMTNSLEATDHDQVSDQYDSAYILSRCFHCERVEDYADRMLFPVHVGDLFPPPKKGGESHSYRYKVFLKTSYRSYSTVRLALDLEVALKFLSSGKEEELSLYESISKWNTQGPAIRYFAPRLISCRAKRRICGPRLRRSDPMEFRFTHSKEGTTRHRINGLPNKIGPLILYANNITHGGNIKYPSLQ